MRDSTGGLSPELDPGVTSASTGNWRGLVASPDRHGIAAIDNRD